MNYKRLHTDMLEYGEWIKNKKFTPAQLTAIFRKFAGSSDIIVKTHRDKNVDKNQVIIGGSYDPEEDQDNCASITLYITYHPDQKKIYIRDLDWNQICIDLIECSGHEAVHQFQYRARNFDCGPTFFISTCTIESKRADQEYLGNPDEIQAYAFSIAADVYLKNNTSILTYKLISKSAMYKAYVAAFGKEHSIVQSLITQIHFFYGSFFQGKWHVKTTKQTA
jgi:hypothetical protein